MKLGKNTYEWYEKKSLVDKVIKEYGEEKYRKNYYEQVVKKIDDLNAEAIKTYLKDLIKNEPLVGIKIMKN